MVRAGVAVRVGVVVRAGVVVGVGVVVEIVVGVVVEIVVVVRVGVVVEIVVGVMTRKPIKDINKFREQFVRWTLRRASLRWPPRAEARRNARTGQKINPNTGRLCWHSRCAICSKEYPDKDMELDHVEPVVEPDMREVQQSDVPGGTNSSYRIGSLVLRMFPEASGLQVLCTDCHSDKTRGENERRKLTRARSKGRQGKIDVEPAALEGSRRNGTSIDVRGQKVQPQWLAECSRCQISVSSSLIAPFACPKCGGAVGYRIRAKAY